MSYAKSLRNTLKDKDEALYNRLQPIEETTRTLMTYTASKFPYYTPHDFLHSQNVEEILNWLVPDEIKSKMNAHEIFFLLVGAWLHDWGMVASESENAEEVRRLHHVRTEENFEKLHDKVHLNISEARIVGHICRGHREENLLDPAYDDTFLGSNIRIRVRFLASLLRIADECDVTANRTPEIIYYSLRPEGASEEEYQKHLSITGIGKSAPYKLVLSGVARTPRGAEVIEEARTRIQSQLNSVKAILGAQGVILDLVEAQIDTRGFINKPIAFELDRKAIVRLLIGNALYSRKDVAVRELLQNAVDTCRLRKLVDSDYEPRIEIEFDNERISFADNGMGMNYEEAFEFFARKGSSFYVSNDLKEVLEGKEFDPIGKFGIGVLSSFMISDRMVVETKKKNCAPCRFTVTDLAEGWTYEEGSRQESGTKITLTLNEKGKNIDLMNSLRHYAKKVVIPIFVKNSTTGEKEELLQVWDYTIPEVLEAISKEDRESFSQSKPVLTLNACSSGLEITYHLFENTHFSFDKTCFLLNHGIYAGDFGLFPCNNGQWIALIDVKSDLLDLTVSRESLVKNEKLKSFLEMLYGSLFEAIDRFTNETRASGSDALKKCIEFSTCADRFFRDSFGVEKSDIRVSLLWRFYGKRKYPVLLRDGLTFLTGDEISLQVFSKILHYRLPLKFCNEHIEAISAILTPKMREKDAVVFDPGPHLQSIQAVPRKFLCGFCETLKSRRIDAIECCVLADLLPKLEYSKESTAIDSLLPQGSYFTHMPESFRSVAALVRPFGFSPSPETDASSRQILLSVYLRLVARELFGDDPEIVAIYNSGLWPEQRRCELLSSGHFVYDMDDSFLKYVISKASLVLSNESTRKLVERYVRLLGLYYISPSFLGHPSAEAYSLAMLEKTIAEVLGLTEYTPLKDRASKLALVYNYEM